MRAMTWRLLLTVSIPAIAFLPGAVYAHTVVPVPNVGTTMAEAHGWQNVLELGDMLIWIRYELPTADWRTSTYINDTACADADNFTDPCYTEVVEGAALHTFYGGAHNTADLRGFRHIPRIGHGLSALYFAAGHDLTFGTVAYETCIEGSATLFNPIPHDCFTVQWRSSATVDATPAVMEPHLVQMALNLERVLERPANEFVNVDKITLLGLPFPREAFSPIVTVVPGAFFSSVVEPFSDFNPGSAGALETSIQTAAEASSFYTDLNRASQEYFGLPVRIFGTIITFLLGLLAVFGVAKVTGSLPLSTLAGALMVGFGFFMNFIPPAAMFIALVIILLLGSTWVFRRLPT